MMMYRDLKETCEISGSSFNTKDNMRGVSVVAVNENSPVELHEASGMLRSWDNEKIL